MNRLICYFAFLSFSFGLMALQAAPLEVELLYRYDDGKYETKRAQLVREGSVDRLKLPAGSFSNGIKFVEVRHPLATGQGGEDNAERKLTRNQAIYNCGKIAFMLRVEPLGRA